MIARMMQLKCAGYGPKVTASDKRKSATVILAGTLALTPLWVWAQWRQENAYVLALAPMTCLLPYVLSLHYTSVKRRSLGAQAIVIGGLGVALAALLGVVGWISIKI